MRTIALAAGLAMVGAAPGRVSALNRWTWQDTAWEATFAAALAADWYTTQRVVVDGGGVEVDPLAVRFIGRHPSSSELAIGCLTGMAAHAAISYVLPRRWRRVWQAATITLEVGAVAHNFQGIRDRSDGNGDSRFPSAPAPHGARVAFRVSF